MAYIEKMTHASGRVTYRARVRQKGFPDKSQCFPTRKEATAWGKRMEADIRAGRYFGREEAKERTFAEFIDRYIEKELPKNPKEEKKNTYRLSWWKKHLGKYYLCHITSSMISELRDKLMTEKTPKGTLRTSSTTNRFLAALSRAFTICQREWHWIQENPVLKIQRPKENKGRERYLKKEEIARLLSVCKKSKSQYLYAVVLFAVATGARKGEILGLKWKDVDFVRCTATFRDTKNGETRTIHLGEAIVKCLKEEQKKRTILSPYVFPSRDGSQPADTRKAWENARKEAGLNNSDVVFHTLRHTTISHLSMAGNSALQISSISGHKSLSQLKRYCHLSISSTASALDRMNDEILSEVTCG